jgi:DinB superfamily
MKEAERIAAQLRRAHYGPAWHGSSLRELLSGVTAARAAVRPVPGAHNVWEIVLHIMAWATAMRQRLAGARAEIYQTELDWPTVNDPSEAAWQQTLAELTEAHDKLRQAIMEVEDARLDEPIMEGMASVYVSLHGGVQHDLYHAGQIAMLLKATAS